MKTTDPVPGFAIHTVSPKSRFAKKRVAVVGRGDERLLDRTGLRPPQQFERRSRLVVRAARARAAERLLADHRAGRLVVDVEVAGRVAQRGGRLDDRLAIAREDRAGE